MLAFSSLISLSIREVMKPSRLRILAQLLLVFYLLGGHAAAHGLSWCLEGNHSHLEQETGQCASPEATSSCSEESMCVSAALVNPGDDGQERRTECRHLPTTSPHQSSFTQRLDRANDYSAPSLAPTPVRVPLNLPAPNLALLRHATEHLPPLQALTALRTIVLSC